MTVANHKIKLARDHVRDKNKNMSRFNFNFDGTVDPWLAESDKNKKKTLTTKTEDESCDEDGDDEKATSLLTLMKGTKRLLFLPHSWRNVGT